MKPINDVIADGHQVSIPDPRTVLLDRAVEALERELRHRLDTVERPAVVRLLEQLADDWPESGSFW